MENIEEQYLCVGICMADSDSGYCLGCGRPPFGTPETSAAAPVALITQDTDNEPDTPE